MDREKIKKAVKDILEAIGEDPQRPELKDTPQRVAQMCEEVFGGTHLDPHSELAETVKEDHKEMVIVKNISFSSICEHHLLPFIGEVSIAYIPKGKRVAGLSKLSRVVDILSKRAQLQERLTTQIAEVITKALNPRGVLVIVRAEHMCIRMRGVKRADMPIITSAVRGSFKTNSTTRAEAMSLISPCLQG